MSTYSTDFSTAKESYSLTSLLDLRNAFGFRPTALSIVLRLETLTAYDRHDGCLLIFRCEKRELNPRPFA